MSTRLLYRTFGVRTFDLVRTTYERGATFFHLRKQALTCMNCGARCQESRDLAQPRKSYTRAFAQLVLELAGKMTILDIARYLQVGCDLVKGIIRDDLQRRASRRSWRQVRRIAIDEFAVRKGQNYKTLAVDLDSGHVLYWAEGKDHTSLEAFFRRLRRAGAKLEANELLHEVYLLTEDLRLFWSQMTRKQAEKFLRRWCAEARTLGNRHVTRLANTIMTRLHAILAWYDHPITTGPLEGINNKVKVLKRVAYGYRDNEFFGLRLLFLHEVQFKHTGT